MSIPKVLIALVLWLIYSVVVYQGCNLEECCSDKATEEETTTAVTTPDVQDATRYPLDFEWDNAIPYTNEGFAAFKDSTLTAMTADNILEIVGLYSEGEAKPANFENMGFARADAIRQLFLADIPEDRVRLRARLNGGEGVKEGYFEASDFNWIASEKQAAPTLAKLDDRVIIRFPTNSTRKNADEKVDEYLETLAERVKTSGEHIEITGHTDNVGDADGNLQLSKKRAEKVRDILLSKGVDAALITIAFKGETQPVAPNETENDRQENRRAEVRLIKNN